MTTIPVIICGAGPVGLTLSILLSRLGIQHTIIEKHPGTAIHPKARGVNVRTMEIFRQLGVEDAIRQHELPAETRRLLWIENVRGKIVAAVNIEDDCLKYSPTNSCAVTQDHIESELLKSAKDYPACDIRFSTLLTDFQQDGSGVTCTLLNRKIDQIETVHCQYLIACDGAHSTIRQKLNIEMIGQENLGDFLSVYCTVDLRQYLEDKLGIVTVMTDQSVAGKFIMAVDHKKKWIIAERLQHLEQSYSNDYCTSLVRQVAGDSSIPVEDINASIWQMAALNASQYRVGNILLAGDAAHRIPPTGGMGMNAGIQDAHNLAWKLAAVIKRQCKPSLLDTYFEERHPFNQYVIDWSIKNSARISAIYKALFENDLDTFNKNIHEQKDHLNHVGLDIGFIYPENSTISKAEIKNPFNPSIYEPYIQVGMRAPHTLIRLHDKTISTLDLFEDEYVLLISEEAVLDKLKLELPIPTGMPLRIYRYKKDFFSIDEKFDETYQLKTHAAVLVRPDGYVAFIYRQ